MNRVKEAAAKVLKQHERGIKVDGDFLEIRLIGDPHRQRERLLQACDELKSALAVMAGPSAKCETTISEGDSLYVTCFLRNEGPGRVQSNQAPIDQLAASLADAGINFPGSERFVSKQVGWGRKS